MDKNNYNLFELSYDDINAMKKRDVVDQIDKMKGKVVVGSHVKDLCHQIEKLTEKLNDVVATNEKITNELLIVKNVNSNLEKRIATLEKLQAKTEQYSRRGNAEISGIPNDILDNDHEKKVIEICKDSDIVITSSDIEDCHRLLLIAGIKCKTFWGINHSNHSTQIKSKLFSLKDALTDTNNVPSIFLWKIILELTYLIRNLYIGTLC